MVLVHLLSGPWTGLDQLDRDGNRAELARPCRPGRSRPGLLAYRDERVVGWVSLGPREDFGRLAHSKVLAPVDDTPVWSIVCFVVSRKVRGQGVATALLAAASTTPARTARPCSRPIRSIRQARRSPPANAYHGTLRMFERAGFNVVARRQHNATSPRPTHRPPRTLTREPRPRARFGPWLLPRISN